MSWVGGRRARWWFLFAVESDSQTQAERAGRPQALLVPRLPVIPACQGLPFIIPESPAVPPPWGCHPLGEVIAAQKSNQSSYHVPGTQLRIITFFPSLQKCQAHIYLE